MDRTPNKDKKATCPECGLTFSNSGNAKRHYITKHAEQRPMNCPICRQEFPNKPRYGFNFKSSQHYDHFSPKSNFNKKDLLV